MTNKVFLKGRVGKDCEVKNTVTVNIGSFTLATSNHFTKDESKKTDWHNITLFGKQVDSLAQYITKGKELVIVGRIQYDKYEKDGQKMTATKIIAEEIEFCGSNKSEDEEPIQEKPVKKTKKKEELSEDIPF